MVVCFFINFIVVKPDPLSILGGTFIPLIPSGSLGSAVGLVGSVIMPHNLYLHSSLVLTRKINHKNVGALKEANYYNAIESAISLFVSFIINFTIISTFAYWHDKPNAEDLNLRNASIAFEGAFGRYASIIWAVGLLAAG